MLPLHIMEELNQTEERIEREPYDVIVIGAGAAGMMAAGTAARQGKRVLLLEKMEKSELSTLRFDEYNEQFYWILWVVAGLLLLEGLLLDRRNPRLRKFNIFEK